MVIKLFKKVLDQNQSKKRLGKNQSKKGQLQSKKSQLRIKETNFLLPNQIKNRKGQLKIQQMAFMLLAVTLFFVLVGMFVLLIQFSGLKEASRLIEEENALLLVSKLAESPEFSCGSAFQNIRVNCIDLDKIKALKENIAEYTDFWGVEGIEIRKIYPSEEKIEVLSNQGEGVGVSNFVALCQKINENGENYDKCEMGKLIVVY